MKREILDALTMLLVAACVGYLGYQIGHARGRTRGYTQCLGAMDEDAMSTKVWRAAK